MSTRISPAAPDTQAMQRSSGTRIRRVIAVLLIVVGLALAPVAAVGAWVRLQLVDTDSFVSTFAPLAENPSVQTFVADQSMRAIKTAVDIPALVGDVFDGLLTLDMPPRTARALALLEGPAAEGMVAVVASTVDDVVASPRFAGAWREALQFTHTQATAIIQDQPGMPVQLNDEGALSLELGVIIAEVRTVLIDRGMRFAEAIPDVSRSVPLVQSDALASVQAGYRMAAVAGFWLPWAALALVTAGVLLTRHRTRALTWTGMGFAAVFALLTLALSIVRGVFAAAVSPSIMPTVTAHVLYDQLTSLIVSAATALIIVGVVIAGGAWSSHLWRARRRPLRDNI